MYATENKAATMVRLFTVCELEIDRAQSTRFWIEEFDCELVGLPILEIAKFISSDSELATGQALSALCDDKAVEALLKMPNQFWFWTTLRDTLLHQGHLDSKLGFSAVRSALEARRTYLGYKSGSFAVSKLSNVEACELLAKGLIVLKKSTSSKTKLVRNPLLTKPSRR